MAQVKKIDSNFTGLRYAEEASPGVLPPTPVWIPLEPNSYDDFGGEVTTVARNPINPSRQRKKGVVVDLEATAGFEQDLTQENLQDLLQGFMFADMRRKNELPSTDTTTSAYTVASGGDSYVPGDLLFAKGFDEPTNNGLKHVDSGGSATTIPVTETLVTSTSQNGTVVRVGFQFDAGDAEISAPGGGVLPRLTTTVKDCEDFGLIPGEWIYIGGDLAVESFNTPGNNGFVRVKSVSQNEIVFDKSQGTMADEAGGSKTIKIFFGRVLKNETGSLIKRRTYQFERTLGAPDDANPGDLQAEYITNCIASEFTLNMQTGEILTTEMSFLAGQHETRTAAQGLKAGTRPQIAEADAFNAANDVARINLSVIDPTTSTPSNLFAYIQEGSISINNNLSYNKAVSVLGAFDVTAGTFEVSGELTAYFTNVEAIQAVQDNADVTFDLHLVKANAGISIDFPLLSLGDGLANVEQDEAVTLPLELQAATGAKYDPNMDHTMLWVFYDYLPNRADT